MDQIYDQFVSDQNIQYLIALTGCQATDVRRFANDRARSLIRTFNGMWPEIRRLNRFFVNAYKTGYIVETDQFHIQAFMDESIRPPGFESLNFDNEEKKDEAYYMRYKKIPFWQKTGRRAYDPDISEALGCNHCELTNRIAGWDMSRLFRK